MSRESGWTYLKIMSGNTVVEEGGVRDEHMAQFLDILWQGKAKNGGALCGAIEAIAQECAVWEIENRENLSHRQQWERDVLVRAGYRCERCRKYRPLQIHHSVYKSRGGRDGVDNTEAICERCHSQEHRPGSA